MKTNGRDPDPVFHPEERLFRRVPIRIWADPNEELPIEAMELPDISVGRSKYGHAEWVRLGGDDGMLDWGVIGVKTQDVPDSLMHAGIFQYEFVPTHDPTRLNYPHSEIRAFEDGKHVRANIPEELDLRFRHRLLLKTRVIIKPFQEVAIRENAPVSHLPEPLQFPGDQ